MFFPPKEPMRFIQSDTVTDNRQMCAHFDADDRINRSTDKMVGYMDSDARIDGPM